MEDTPAYQIETWALVNLRPCSVLITPHACANLKTTVTSFTNTLRSTVHCMVEYLHLSFQIFPYPTYFKHGKVQCLIANLDSFNLCILTILTQ